MNAALLVMTSACMFHFTGSVPSQLSELTIERSGARQLADEAAKQFDERYLNEEWRIYGEKVAIGAQVIFQQKLILKTEF